MSYLGNQARTIVTAGRFTTKDFTGDGATLTFTLDYAPSSASNLRVVQGGVTQDPGTDYSTSGVSLIFVTAPSLGIGITTTILGS